MYDRDVETGLVEGREEIQERYASKRVLVVWSCKSGHPATVGYHLQREFHTDSRSIEEGVTVIQGWWVASPASINSP